MYKKWNMRSIIFSLVVLLVGIGVVYVASITVPIGIQKENSATYYIYRYVLNAIFSVVIAVLFYYGLNALSKTKRDQSTVDLILVIVSVIFLAMPLFIGKEINGARRWILLPGIGQVQPSELIRPIMIVLLSKFYFNFDKDRRSVFKAFVIITLTFFAIVWFQKSKTSAIQLAAIGYLMYCVSKVPEIDKFVVGAISLLGGLVVLLFKVKDYSAARITGFMSTNQPDQVKAGLLAIKSGSIFGRGIGEGYQKYFYLSEAHNDYVFSAIAEEGGFIWCIVLLLIFAALIFILFWAAYSMKYSMYKYMAYGVAFNIANQTLGHLAINLNLIPSTGITLPFISYGGSSFMANLMCIALMFFAIKQSNKEEE